MRILFDHGTPAPLIQFLKGHTVTKAKDVGRERLENGELIRKAEEAGFDVLVSTDKNIRYQQNLGGRKIALIVLGNQQWPIVRRHVQTIAACVNNVKPGSFSEVDVPF